MLSAIGMWIVDMALVLLGALLLYLSVPAILQGVYTFWAFVVAALGLFIIGRAATVILDRK